MDALLVRVRMYAWHVSVCTCATNSGLFVLNQHTHAHRKQDVGRKSDFLISKWLRPTKKHPCFAVETWADTRRQACSHQHRCFMHVYVIMSKRAPERETERQRGEGIKETCSWPPEIRRVEAEFYRRCGTQPSLRAFFLHYSSGSRVISGEWVSLFVRSSRVRACSW